MSRRSTGSSSSKYGDAYSVLRAKLDQWLCEKAEEEGVMVINNITVTGLLIEDGKVCGVKMCIRDSPRGARSCP